MAGRGRTSYQKRQKEMLRLEKRQAKAARKEARKANKGSEPDIDYSARILPPEDADVRE